MKCQNKIYRLGKLFAIPLAFVVSCDDSRRKKMSKLPQILGLDKIASFWNIIRQNGGIVNSLHRMYKFDDLKVGKHVGTDKYGNKYFENNYYFYGRNRWVEYAPHIHMAYDASQISVEWYGWMHYKTDRIPTEDPHRPQYKWMSDHSENLSGTPDQYVPYSTVKPKVEAWQPPKKN